MIKVKYLFLFITLSQVVNAGLESKFSQKQQNNLSSCLNKINEAIKMRQLTSCDLGQIKMNNEVSHNIHTFTESDLNLKESQHIESWLKQIKESSKPELTALNLLKSIRQKPDQYSEALLTILMRKAASNPLTSKPFLKANNTLNQIDLVSKSTGIVNPRMSIDRASQSIKLTLDGLKRKLQINRDTYIDGPFFTKVYAMKDEDREKSTKLIKSLTQKLSKFKVSNDPNKLDEHFKLLNHYKSEFDKLDRRSLDNTEEFQETIGSIKTASDIIGALSQSTAIQIAILQGGTPGGTAMAISFCLFQKEYERFAMREVNASSGESESSTFHTNTLKQCSIEATAAATAGKLSIKAFNKIDSKIANKALNSTINTLASSGINIATNTTSIVLQNLFATNSRDPNANVCRTLAQSIKAELDQYRTKEGLGMVLLQSLVFKKLHSIKTKSKNIAQNKSKIKIPKTIEDYKILLRKTKEKIETKRKQRSEKEIRQTIMNDLGITNDTYVYRWVERKFIDTKNNRIKGNPNSVASVYNDYDNKLNHNNSFKYRMEVTEESLPMMGKELVTKPNNFFKSKVVKAKDEGAGLNCSIELSNAYGSNNDPGVVLIKIKVGDVINLGGRIYKDSGAFASSLKPIYLTLPNNQSVPFELVNN